MNNDFVLLSAVHVFANKCTFVQQNGDITHSVFIVTWFYAYIIVYPSHANLFMVQIPIKKFVQVCPSLMR